MVAGELGIRNTKRERSVNAHYGRLRQAAGDCGEDRSELRCRVKRLGMSVGKRTFPMGEVGRKGGRKIAK